MVDGNVQVVIPIRTGDADVVRVQPAGADHGAVVSRWNRPADPTRGDRLDASGQGSATTQRLDTAVADLGRRGEGGNRHERECEGQRRGSHVRLDWRASCRLAILREPYVAPDHDTDHANDGH